MIAVAAIVLGGLVALARPTAGVEDPRFARLQAGLRRVTETGAGLTARRRSWRSRSHGDHDDDPSEIEREVREQLYGRSALKAERGPAPGAEAPGDQAPGDGAPSNSPSSSELAA